MERALNDMRNLPNVITEFLSLYADANTANNFLSLDEDGNISDTAINSISNQVVEPCLADRAAVALVEFKASIMLIVSLWAYDSSVLSVTPSNT
jgi:hypothetical protein